MKVQFHVGATSAVRRDWAKRAALCLVLVVAVLPGCKLWSSDSAKSSAAPLASTESQPSVDDEELPPTEEEIPAVSLLGAGTLADPYQISNFAELNTVRHYRSAHFQVKADIDAHGSNFTPIPNFTGEFDGNGYTISNLSISSPSSSFVGFFAKLSGATVKNLVLSNLVVSGKSYVGGLAGRIGPGSLVSRVSTSGTVTATSEYAGGLAGRAQFARVIQSKSSSIVAGTSLAGGLLGSCSEFCEVVHAYATGAVTGTTLVGGLVGDLGVGSKVDYVFARGTVVSNSSAPLMERSTSDADVAGWDPSVYSLAASISNAFFDSAVTNESAFGTGASGSDPGSTFSSWDTDVWTLSASAFPRLKYFDSPSSTPAITEPALTPSLCSNSTPFDGGEGTRSSPFLISTAEQLQNLNCNPQASFRLTSDIDMAGLSYSRPVNFSGQFDGAGHTISNLTIPRVEGVWKTGLFDSLKGGIVKDLSVQNATVTGNYSVGVIAGHTEKGAVVLRCRTSGSVTVLGGTITYLDEAQYDWGAGAGGGVVGSMWFSIVAESTSSVNVTAVHRSGGLVGSGEPQAMIWDSYATGKVNCGSMCGRLAGVMAWSSSGSNSYSIGSGTLVAYGGGMVGSAMNPANKVKYKWDRAIWDTTSSKFPLLRDLSSNFSGATLSTWNRSGWNLSGWNLSGSVLSNADFSSASLAATNLSGANLSGANLTGANLIGADLMNANLSEANLSEVSYCLTRMPDGSINNSNCSGFNFSAWNLSGESFAGIDLSNVNFSGANLSNVNFSGANLSNVSFMVANLQGADLSGADLSGVKYCATTMPDGSTNNSNCSGGDLSGLNLSGRNFSGADLNSASLTGANLSGANLSAANLDSVDLSDANLTNANLSGANLTWAYLWRSDLTNANLSGANLSGADLWNATISGANFTGAVYCDTYMPDQSVNSTSCQE